LGGLKFNEEGLSKNESPRITHVTNENHLNSEKSENNPQGTPDVYLRLISCILASLFQLKSAHFCLGFFGPGSKINNKFNFCQRKLL